ncbi:CdaR family transcriptional regulator [Clostridium sp.]|uniref:CdaR family transcriptional regulator n=1 Tax=Clostridium sp. TaxID=1506 RepID=UPI003464979B
MTSEQGQSIVDKMMKVIPYNINVMDNVGTIIGSGQSERIGVAHEGAIEAIKTHKMVEIHYDGDNAKKGVNLPIRFRGNVVGVIGISGNPDEVRAFAELVKVTAELLIKQQYMLDEKRFREKLEEEFFYHWIYNTKEYEEEFIQRGKDLDIDISLLRRAVVIDGKDIEKERIKKILFKGEYVLNYYNNKILILINKERDINVFINSLIKRYPNIEIAFGRVEKIIGVSAKQAIKALDIGKTIPIYNRIYDYEKVSIVDLIVKNGGGKSILEKMRALDEEGRASELMDTLITFIKRNGEMSKVAEDLHIHRNSLSYRLNKIESITGKNPRNYMDLYELINGVLVYSFHNKTVQLHKN